MYGRGALLRTGTDRYQSDFARRWVAEGRAEGRAEVIVLVLSARGIEVPEDARARILACTDLAQIDAWVERAATVPSIEGLLD
jgi:hypothetical protein